MINNDIGRPVAVAQALLDFVFHTESEFYVSNR
jgi:hypothetical protein